LLIDAAKKGMTKITTFNEPDIDNQLTAIAFAPSEEARKLTSSLPLMGKGEKS